jgi:antitoxin component YwqK of YwqJK toxin-antitoxin module
MIELNILKDRIAKSYLGDMNLSIFVNKFIYGKVIETDKEYETKYCIKHGLYKQYYENGSLEYISTYKNGKLNGEYKEWSDKGILVEHSHYKDSKLHGEYKLYYDSGKLYRGGVYINGEREGEFKELYSDGQLLFHAIYKNDEICYMIKL